MPKNILSLHNSLISQQTTKPGDENEEQRASRIMADPIENLIKKTN